MHIDNLNRLIAHMEDQPPERINMGVIAVTHYPECGTAGCILGHADLVFGNVIGIAAIGELGDYGKLLFTPPGFSEERQGVRRYPAHRVIATLKRLRDAYLSTGQVVVDWGPEPGEEGDHWGSSKPWATPQVAEVINPALPIELTRLLHDTVEA